MDPMTADKNILIVEIAPVFDSCLVCRVVSQVESTRGAGLLFEHGGCTLKSVICPSCQVKKPCGKAKPLLTLFVRGDSRSDDDYVATCAFSTAAERDDAIRRLREVVDAFNAQWRPQEWWANIYPNGTNGTWMYKTREEADSAATARRVRCILLREVV